MTSEVAKRATRDAAIMGMIALAVSLALTLVYASGAGIGQIDWFNWAELLVLGTLSVGVWRNSRIAAIGLLIFFVSSRAYFWIDEQALIGVPITLIMAWFFWRGVRGTFALASSTSQQIVAAH